jgi:hypothetical protein
MNPNRYNYQLVVLERHIYGQGTFVPGTCSMHTVAHVYIVPDGL